MLHWYLVHERHVGDFLAARRDEGGMACLIRRAVTPDGERVEVYLVRVPKRP